MSGFNEEKLNRLSRVDVSRKGSVDTRIQPVVRLINRIPQYYTTSSCSGRTVILSSAQASGSEDCHVVRKKGCVWHHVTHEKLDCSELESSLEGHGGSAVLRFEPFILHVRCCTLEDARKLLATSIAAGCRNSGITIGKVGKPVVAVRNTLLMEVPLSQKGELLVTHGYLCFLTNEANTKMDENWKRLERFYTAVCSMHDDVQGLLPRRRPGRTFESRRSSFNHQSHEDQVDASQEDYTSEVSSLFDEREQY